VIFRAPRRVQPEEVLPDREQRLEFARPFWEALSKAERHALLKLPLDALAARAAATDVGARPSVRAARRAARVRTRRGARGALHGTACAHACRPQGHSANNLPADADGVSCVRCRACAACRRAPDVAGQSLGDILTDGVARLRKHGTWKRWRCFLTEGALAARRATRAHPRAPAAHERTATDKGGATRRWHATHPSRAARLAPAPRARAIARAIHHPRLAAVATRQLRCALSRPHASPNPETLLSPSFLTHCPLSARRHARVPVRGGVPRAPARQAEGGHGHLPLSRGQPAAHGACVRFRFRSLLRPPLHVGPTYTHNTLPRTHADVTRHPWLSARACALTQAAEKELRERMAALLDKVRSGNAAFHDDLARSRDSTGRAARRMSQEQINDAIHRVRPSREHEAHRKKRSFCTFLAHFSLIFAPKTHFRTALGARRTTLRT
jgi:hypothetical protein